MKNTNLSFVVNKNGVTMKRKSNTIARRIENDASYERTRENMSEFARAMKAAKLFSLAFRSITPPHITRKIVQRLHPVFLKVLQADAVNERGNRTVTAGALSGLKDFNFNPLLDIRHDLVKSTGIDRAAGLLTLDTRQFKTDNLTRPRNATHFKLLLGGAAVDFNNGDFENAFASTDFLPIVDGDTAPLSLTVNLTAGVQHPIFLVVGIEYYEQLHGRMVIFKNKSNDVVQVAALSVQP